ncbi:hypothetical protein evm_000954 [Chilo suppressalis]|nr:hypothetical protein evm_000954 [Chilo suppressalis]
MADELELESVHTELLPVNSGAIRFKIKGNFCTLWLVSSGKPYRDIYEIRLCSPESFVTCCKTSINKCFHTEDILSSDSFKHLWISWYNNRVCVGNRELVSFIEFPAQDKENHNQIGYIQFNKSGFNRVEWKIEVSPHSTVMPLQTKQIKGGKLHWVHVQNTNDKLPPDALIGGFDNEPTYIIRAYHHGVLSLGRFIPSERFAIIPWGVRVYAKSEFEILCGYDAIWVQTTSKNIPENAFVVGPGIARKQMYIGRAMKDGNLITGKVYAHNKKCSLPFKNQEIIAGDKSDPSNFRPISVLPALSKVFEKIIYNQLLAHFSINKLLHLKQFGFTRGNSTTDAVTALLKHIFDIWRKVVINEAESTGAPISMGVPQGSILGPLLFLIYINDLPHFRRDLCETVLFTDDTSLVFKARRGNDCYDEPVELVDSTKFLGITLDSHLQWDPHMPYQVDRALRLSLLKNKTPN